jgi:hypothetical protein
VSSLGGGSEQGKFCFLWKELSCVGVFIERHNSLRNPKKHWKYDWGHQQKDWCFLIVDVESCTSLGLVVLNY